MKSTTDRPLVNLAIGAVSGLAATWVMGKATTFLYENEDKTARKREDKARGGKSAYQTAAEKVARLAGRRLTKEQGEKAGTAIHWALGVGTGVAYAFLRRRNGGGLGKGALLGTAVWLLLDEIGNAALGLTPGPKAFPWQAHARGLAGHLVLGLTTEGLMKAADLAA